MKFVKNTNNVQTMIIKPAESMDEYVIDTSTMIPDDLEVYDLMKQCKRCFNVKLY